ncbi:MAG: carbohydrate ABC transporter permease [Candidatus Ozemobacteraceae bacterium]
MSGFWGTRRPGWLFRTIAIGCLIIGMMTYVYPLAYMLFRSFLTTDPSFGTPLPPFTLEHYRLILGEAGFLQYTSNSVLVLVAVVCANLLFSLLAGYAFARYRFPFKNFLFGIILATLMVPKQVLVVPILDVMVRLGLHDTLWALILPFAVDSFNIFLVRQYLCSIPPDLEDAARVDGAGELRLLWDVVFPLCRPALALVIINTAITTWNAFLFPLILTDSARERTLPVGLAMFTQGPFSTDWGALMAGSAVGSLPIIILFILFQREIIEGITAGAMKE